MNLKDLNLNNITTDPMDTTFVDDLNEDIKVGFQHITMFFRSLSLFVLCCVFHNYSLMVFLTRKWPKKFKGKKYIWKECNQGRQKLGKRLKEWKFHLRIYAVCWKMYFLIELVVLCWKYIWTFHLCFPVWLPLHKWYTYKLKQCYRICKSWTSGFWRSGEKIVVSRRWNSSCRGGLSIFYL